MRSKQEILKGTRSEIKAKLARELFTGEYHSAFKGRGMSFKEVREYTPVMTSGLLTGMYLQDSGIHTVSF